MGIKVRNEMLDFFRRIAPNSIQEVVPKKDQSKYRASRRPASARDNYTLVTSYKRGAHVVVFDLLSYIRSFCCASKSCAETARRLVRLLDKLICENQAKFLVCCIDTEEDKPPAKHIEAEKRNKKRRAEPYVKFVELCSGARVPLDEYNFGVDESFPANSDRIFATPVLNARLYQFFASYIHDEYCPLTDVCVIVSGAGVVEESGDYLPATLCAWFNRDGLIGRDYRDAVRIGEGETQCVYWALRLMRLDSCTSVEMVSNDSDSFALLLANMPRFVAVAGEEVAVRLDFTAPSTPNRFADIVAIWRAVMIESARVCRESDSSHHQHDPIGALLLATLANGCDYIDPIPNMGASAILRQYLSDPLVLAAGHRDQNSASMVCSGEGMAAFGTAMVCDENKMHKLLWESFMSHRAVVKYFKDREKRKLRDLKQLPMHKRIDQLSAYMLAYSMKVHKFNEDLAVTLRANPNLKGKKGYTKQLLPPQVPPYAELRAFVRRVYTVYEIMRNSSIGGYMVGSETAAYRGVSIYGFETVFDEARQKMRCRAATAVVQRTIFDNVFVHRVLNNIGECPLISINCKRKKSKPQLPSADMHIWSDMTIEDMRDMHLLIEDTTGSYVESVEAFDQIRNSLELLRSSPDVSDAQMNPK